MRTPILWLPCWASWDLRCFNLEIISYEKELWVKRCISFNMALLVSSQNPVKKWSWQMAPTLEVSGEKMQLPWNISCFAYVSSSELWRCQNADLWLLTMNSHLNSDKSVYNGMFSHFSVTHLVPVHLPLDHLKYLFIFTNWNWLTVASTRWKVYFCLTWKSQEGQMALPRTVFRDPDFIYFVGLPSSRVFFSFIQEDLFPLHYVW